MVLVGHFIAWLEHAGESNLAQLARAGLTPDLMDRLRRLTIVEAMRLAANPCGLTIAVDVRALDESLARLDRSREARVLYEAFIRRGASVALIARLFGVAAMDVRRRRALLAPEHRAGGRPQLPPEDEREDIRDAWRQLGSEGLGERERYWELAERYPQYTLVALENVVTTPGDAP